MQFSDTRSATVRTWGPPGKIVGAVAGSLVVVGFTVVHGIFIVDIWDGIRRMLIAGALCGVSVAWSYNRGVAEHSTSRWFAYNGGCAAILVALGVVSFLVLEPQFTMAELEGSDDALAKLIPPALPLMIGASVIGALALWALFGRQGKAFLSVLVAQTLLVFLVGHNLAILGLVESSSELFEIALEFVGLTVFLAGGFAAVVMLIEWVRTRPAGNPG